MLALTSEGREPTSVVLGGSARAPRAVPLSLRGFQGTAGGVSWRVPPFRSCAAWLG